MKLFSNIGTPRIAAAGILLVPALFFAAPSAGAAETPEESAATTTTTTPTTTTTATETPAEESGEATTTTPVENPTAVTIDVPAPSPENLLPTITSRPRTVVDSCGEVNIVNLELLDTATGGRDLVVSNASDCGAAVMSASLSPDRSLLAYQSANGPTAIMDLASRTVLRSVHGCDGAQWNPDGTLLACAEPGGGIKVIVVASGRNVNSLRLPGGNSIDAYDWVAPTELLVTSAGAGSACTIPADSGSRRTAMWRIEIAQPTITSMLESPCGVPYEQIQVSPDGDKILIISSANLYVAGINGGASAKVVLDLDSNDYTHVRAAEWTSSGHDLIVVTEPANSVGVPPTHSRIEVIDAISGERRIFMTLDRQVVGVGDAEIALLGHITSDSGEPSATGATETESSPVGTGSTGTTSTGTSPTGVGPGQSDPSLGTATSSQQDATTTTGPSSDGSVPGTSLPAGTTEGTTPATPGETSPGQAGQTSGTITGSSTDSEGTGLGLFGAVDEDLGIIVGSGNSTGDTGTDPTTTDPVTSTGNTGTDPATTDAVTNGDEEVAVIQDGAGTDPVTTDPVTNSGGADLAVGILTTSSDPVIVHTIGDDPDDQIPPELTFVGLKDSYLPNEKINITCVVSDEGSGVDTSTCDSLSGKAFLFRGSNTVVGKVTDLAGNSTEVTLTFSVMVSIIDLVTVLHALVDETPAVDAVLDPLVAELAAGNCGPPFQTYGTETRRFAAEGTLTAAESIEIYSLGIAICKG